MLLIRAIIRPEKTGIVMSELVAAGFPAKTGAGTFGDGRIFISPVDEAYTISTGKAGL